jgi:hypothetical protein
LPEKEVRIEQVATDEIQMDYTFIGTIFGISLGIVFIISIVVFLISKKFCKPKNLNLEPPIKVQNL